MDPPEFGTPAFINVDIDANNNISNDLPGWIRDAVERALGANGINIGRKLASEEVIDRLEEIPFNQIESDSKDCPICYDAYVEINTRRRRRRLSSLEEETDDLDSRNTGKAPTESAEFNDPSLFFPLIESADIHTRFPPRCLIEKTEPTLDECLPGYEEAVQETPSIRIKNDTQQFKEEIHHTPVKMPGCNHIFGKSCIIEWLKNNVSCPLCRREVESQSRDPKVLKRNRIRNNIYNNFEQDEEEIIEFITESLTDVFHPFKRPYNSRVTPLTDRYMPQDWCKPLHTWKQEANPEMCPDPELILVKKFPVPDFSSLPLRRTTLPTINNFNNPSPRNDARRLTGTGIHSLIRSGRLGRPNPTRRTTPRRE